MIQHFELGVNGKFDLEKLKIIELNLKFTQFKNLLKTKNILINYNKKEKKIFLKVVHFKKTTIAISVTECIVNGSHCKARNIQSTAHSRQRFDDSQWRSIDSKKKMRE